VNNQITSHALWSAQAHMPSVIGNQIEIVGGDGAYVTTAQGDRLLDATAGLWYANVGHGRRELADAAHALSYFVRDVIQEIGVISARGAVTKRLPAQSEQYRKDLISTRTGSTSKLPKSTRFLLLGERWDGRRAPLF